MANADDVPMVSWRLPEYLDLMRTENSQAFARLEASNAQAFQEIKSALNGKADKSDVERLEHSIATQANRLDGHDRQLDTINAERRLKVRKREWWKWAVPTFSAVLAAAGALAVIFVH